MWSCFRFFVSFVMLDWKLVLLGNVSYQLYRYWSPQTGTYTFSLCLAGWVILGLPSLTGNP